MLKILIRKQLMEIFRKSFYDEKKKTGRSRWKTLLSLILFGVLLVGVMGGIFTGLSLLICKPLAMAGLKWLSFSIMGMIAILFGAFGSVFNTYASMYLSKDNDLLLAMPIPARAILGSRLVGVYLVGLMYSGIASLPVVIVNLCVNGFGIADLIRGLLFVLMISLFVLVISCLLGWAVAKCSRKLKSKSFLTAFLSLIFFALYYFGVHNAQVWLQELVEHATVYGNAIQKNFQPLYVLGNVPLAWTDCGLFCVVTLVLLAATALVLERSFLAIATDTGNISKKHYTEKAMKRRSAAKAVFVKEFKRFTSSANYMLNCGMGSLLLIAAAVALVIKGSAITELISVMPEEIAKAVPTIVAGGICLLTAMNDTAVPSVSLEGKQLWIAQSLPIPTWLILRAKLLVQLVITIPGVVLLGVIAAILLATNLLEGILMVLMPMVYTVFVAEGGLVIGLKTANVQWTNESTPVKQSAGVFIALFGGMVLIIAFAGTWFWFGRYWGTGVFMLACTLLIGVLNAGLNAWLKRRGTAMFEAL